MPARRISTNHSSKRSTNARYRLRRSATRPRSIAKPQLLRRSPAAPASTATENSGARDCNPRHSSLIRQRNGETLAALEVAIHALNSPQARKNEDFLSLFELYFKSRDPAVIAQVQSNINAVYAGLKNQAEFRCAKAADCPPQMTAYVELKARVPYLGSIFGYKHTGPIHLCPQFFRMHRHTQKVALIHEGMHRFLGFRDDTYARHDVTKLPMQRALRNPDSYAQFALEPTLARVLRAGGGSRAPGAMQRLQPQRESTDGGRSPMQAGGDTTPVIRRQPNSVRRMSRVEECRTDSDGIRVHQALMLAGRDLERASAAMMKGPSDPRVRAALWLIFRDQSPDTYSHAVRVLRTMRLMINQTNYFCGYRNNPFSPCFYVRNAAAMHNDLTGNITFCMDALEKMVPWQAANLAIHEISHFAADTDDTVYFVNQPSNPDLRCMENSEGVGASGQSTTAERLRSADAYACLVYQLLYQTPGRLQENSSRARGEDLRILAPTTRVHLNAPSDAKPEIFLDGTENQVHQTRWSLQDERSRKYPLRSNNSEHPGRWHVDNFSVLIPLKTRAKLRDADARAGTLTAETAITYQANDAGDRNIPREIIAKSVRLQFTKRDANDSL